MVIIQSCKAQIVCLLILLYVGIIYIKEGNKINRISEKARCNSTFDVLYIVAEFAVLFDGITACTVNFLDQIPRNVNHVLHLAMFLLYEAFVTILYLYWVHLILGNPPKKWIRPYYLLPSAICIIVSILNIGNLEFIEGQYTNYSMGVSVYSCFACIFFYWFLSVWYVFSKRRFITRHKGMELATVLFFIVIIMTLQIIFPESLVSCIAACMIIVSIYITMENPTIKGLEHYQREMVMGFSTLVENKDDNTGGHIRRSSAYAVMIAKNLRKNPSYKFVMTKDYIDNLEQSAPMHDIGKIGVPDSILQKPGKLTDEEFATMRKHPLIGGKIIKDTFGHLLDGEYENMAYQVAMYHHEKWNGKGYPEGLSGLDIPLCARIMAVADVFDAVSAKRCYRDAMPLEDCYRIIINGKGKDFDPDVVEAFLLDRDKVEEIYYKELDD